MGTSRSTLASARRSRCSRMQMRVPRCPEAMLAMVAAAAAPHKAAAQLTSAGSGCDKYLDGWRGAGHTDRVQGEVDGSKHLRGRWAPRARRLSLTERAWRSTAATVR